MEMAYVIPLIIHAATGGTALVTGLLAMLTRKGGKGHSITGNIYFWSMMLVSITALWMSCYKINWFLLVVGLFTLYGNIGGKLILSKRPTEELRRWWRYFAFMGLGIGAVMSGVSYYLYTLGSFFGTVLGVFAALQLIQAVGDWRYSYTFDPKERILQHIGKMGGTYIATFTAFMSVNFYYLPPMLVWLGPTLVGTTAIIVARTRWRQKLKINLA